MTSVTVTENNVSITIEEIDTVAEIVENVVTVQAVEEVVTVISAAEQGPAGPPGTTDHGLLDGLADDDHSQYHNDARGDARYYTQAQIDSALAGKSNTGHTHTTSDITNFDEAVEDKIGAKVVGGTNVAVSYNDTTGETTVSAAGGSPGGSSGQLQYNNGGAFGASANLTWDESNKTLLATNTTSPASDTYLIAGQVNFGRKFGMFVRAGGNEGGFKADSQFLISAASGCSIRGGTNPSGTMILGQNAGGNPWIFSETGVLQIGYTAAHSTYLTAAIVAATASTVAATIKAAVAQTANLQEWQNSSGAVFGSIGPTGQLTISVQSAVPALSISHPYNGNAIVVSKGGSGNLLSYTAASGQNGGFDMSLTDANTNFANSHVQLVSSVVSSGYDSFSVRGGYFSATQTRNTAGTNGGRPYGIWADASTTASAPEGYAVFGRAMSARVVPLVSRVHASQTSNALEIQNSAGALLSGFKADGSWQPPSLTDAAATNNSVYYSTTASKLVYKDAGGTVNVLY